MRDYQSRGLWSRLLETHSGATARTAGRSTVLIVDPDREARARASRFMELAGFTVLSTGNPHDALRLLRQAAAVDLLVVDELLPEIPGPVLAESARRACPSLPIVLLLHDQEGKAGQGGQPEKPDWQVLPKSFSPHSLLRKACDLLRQMPVQLSPMTF